jgi:hypothetical protein
LLAPLAAHPDRDTRRRMGARARETVESRFTERAMVERYETLFMQLETARNARDNLRRPAGAH